MELWGGIECTINRVGDRFCSQLDRNGHFTRLDDLERIAELGIRQLRFPVLWEQHAPESFDDVDWTWADHSLGKLRELGVKPIVGLLHHGSGPRYTSLIDPEFPEKLARFARAVAKRYPWVDAYTPVNEPLTTARFSGLYGLWYPHGHDEQTFARCLVHQCRGVALAMRAIREVNSEAALVQTDDLGKIYSSPKLKYQADYENERRWLTWDLLTGNLDPNRPMSRHLHALGIAERELAEFQEQPCPPDIIGVNHYITSDRYLDENLEAHPVDTHGGNGRDAYADVAAVRARPEGIAGIESALREAWARYRLPLAVTEAHIGCTREEQLRWFMEVWRGAEKLRGDGADVRAVTVWSVLGALDWNSLLTREDGFYEPGAYDLRSGTLRPTAVAKMVQRLGHDRSFDHPILDTHGWWRRDVRMPVKGETSGSTASSECFPGISLDEDLPLPAQVAGRPILITGATGRLGRGFVRAARLRGLAYRAFPYGDLDIADERAVAAAVQSCGPWAIINCAGFSRVDDAEADQQACLRSNTHGAATLAEICARTGIQLVTFSSDQVFDGGKRDPYVESDEPCAISVYGESKLLAEREVLTTYPRAIVIRPGRVFAPFEDYDFLRKGLRALARGERVRVENDVRLSGTYLPDLVHATLDMLVDGESGLWHLANSGAVTPEQFLIAAADIAQLDSARIDGAPLWQLDRPAHRPRYRALTTERGQILSPLGDAIQRYCHATAQIYAEAEPLVAAS